MSTQDDDCTDLMFTLIKKELIYNHDLVELQKVIRRTVFWKKSIVPLYTRRQFGLILTSLKKHSDRTCRQLEQLLKSNSPLLSDSVMSIICEGLGPTYVASLLALCEVLSELRSTLRAEEDPNGQVDKALIPLQRLVFLNSSVKKITNSQMNNSKSSFEALDLINKVLDKCFEVLTSLEGMNYIADLETMIDYNKSTSLNNILKRDHLKLELKFPLTEMYSHGKDQGNYNKELHYEEQEMRPLSSCSDQTSGYSEIHSTSTEPEIIDLPPYCEIPLNPSPTSLGHAVCLRKSFDESPLYQTIREGEDDYLYEEIPFQINYFRTLWAQLEPVTSSGILNNLNSKQIVLQEAKFEIISSEVSYFKSLCILVDVFYKSPQINQILTKEERSGLFSNIIEVKKVSEKFLEDLDDLLSKDLMLEKISCLVRSHAVSSFRVYIKYCAQQVYLHNVLQILFATNEEFVRLIKDLEWQECQGYSLISFLTLPLQRVTRLPLLLEAVLKKLNPKTAEYHDTKVAFDTVNKLVEECNQVVALKTNKDDFSNIALKFQKNQGDDGRKGMARIKDWAKKTFLIR